MKIRFASLALASLAAGTAAAADDAALARCRGIADNASRLACYDAVPIGVRDDRAPPRSSLTPVAPVAPPAAPAPAPRASAPAAPPAQVFGMEERAAARVELPTTMESTIPGHFEGWGPKARIKLANGQVWQIVDDSTAYFNLDNPRVLIRRGMMGGFFMEVEKSNRSPRVRRVQ